MRALFGLLPYFARYWPKLVLGLLAIALSVGVGLAAPLVIGRAVDSFSTARSSAALVNYALLLLGITAVQGVFNFGQRMLLVTLSRDIERDLRNKYYGHLQTLSPSYYQNSQTGDLMARATNDLQAVRMVCGPAIMYGTNTVFTGIGALFFMARIHLPLTLLALAPMPLVAVATQVFGRRIHDLFARVQEQFASLSARAQENLAGLRVVRSYAREQSEIEKFAQINTEYVARNRHLIRWTSAFHPILQLLVGSGFVAVLWYGGLQVTAGRVSVGEFVTFNFFLSKLVWPVIAIGWVINLVQRGAASLGRIGEVLATEPSIRDLPPLQDPALLAGAIAIRDLEFSYDESPTAVLDAVSLTAEPGERVAIVGRTGSGKSSLLSLLYRGFDPPAGSIFLDGIDIRRLSLTRLRQELAVVPQEAFLFSTTVAENIVMGRPEATPEEVREAAQLAGLEDDLAGFPQGLDTVVGERGVTLSGGQKQRIALARALLRKPRILLLDDCLSAVDADTEERILANLERVFPGRTVIQVSHRISAIRGADLIVVLEAGRVVERGTHDELMAASGPYAVLARRQELERELAVV